MNALTDDFVSAARQLRHDWQFSFASILCLGIGIAAVATIFSVLSQVLFKPLPFPNADRLVMVRSENPVISRWNEQITEPDFYDLQSATRTMDVAAYSVQRLDVPNEHGFHRIHGLYVSDGFLDVLQLKPHLGSTFDSHRPTGFIKQLMLGTSVWRRLFQGRPDIIGGAIRINSWRQTWPLTGDRAFNVVGLLPEGLRYLPCSSFINLKGFGLDKEIEFLTPLNGGYFGDRRWHNRDVIGRLKDGVTVEQADAEVKVIAARLATEFPDTNKDWSMRVVPLDRYIYGATRPTLLAAFAASVFVLAIACGNVAHLMLIRFNRRKSDLAVRAALGATPMRLGRLACFESTIIVVLAALVAGLMAVQLLPLLERFAPRELSSYAVGGLNAVVAMSVATLAMICVVMISLVTQRSLQTPGLRGLLGGSDRTSSAGAGSTRLLRTMVVIQISVAFVLLVAAGMLVARQVELAQTDLGFQPANRLTLTMSLPEAKHVWQQNTIFCHEVMRNTRNLPGVLQVGAIQGLPMGNNRLNSGVIPEGRPTMRRHDFPPAFMRVVTEDYFATMGIPIIHGRPFQPSDGVGEVGGWRSVIVNESLARRCWPDSNPIGRRFKSFQAGPWWEVIGVVGDVRANGVDQQNTMEVYIPERLAPQPHITLIVHCQQQPLSLTNSLREVISAADPDAYITDIKTMRQVVNESQARPRYLTLLLGSLAALGLILATIGVSLTSAFSVARRKHELRIRAACGATPWNLVRLVMWRETITVLFGIAIGLVMAICLQGRFEMDWKTAYYFRPIAFLLVPGCLLSCSLAASCLAAVRFAFSRV